MTESDFGESVTALPGRRGADPGGAGRTGGDQHAWRQRSGARRPWAAPQGHLAAPAGRPRPRPRRSGHAGGRGPASSDDSVHVGNEAIDYPVCRFRSPPSSVGSRRSTAVAALLAAPTIRLLTLTGPGGTGKTRLALAVAEQVAPQFPDGVVFVALAPLSDPALVAPAIAEQLGVRERAEQPLRDALDHAPRRQAPPAGPRQLRTPAPGGTAGRGAPRGVSRPAGVDHQSGRVAPLGGAPLPGIAVGAAGCRTVCRHWRNWAKSRPCASLSIGRVRSNPTSP